MHTLPIRNWCTCRPEGSDRPSIHLSNGNGTCSASRESRQVRLVQGIDCSMMQLSPFADGSHHHAYFYAGSVISPIVSFASRSKGRMTTGPRADHLSLSIGKYCWTQNNQLKRPCLDNDLIELVTTKTYITSLYGPDHPLFI